MVSIVGKIALGFEDKLKLLEFLKSHCDSATDAAGRKHATYHDGWNDARIAAEGKALIPALTLGHVTHMRSTMLGGVLPPRVSAEHVDNLQEQIIELRAGLAHVEDWIVQNFGGTFIPLLPRRD